MPYSKVKPITILMADDDEDDRADDEDEIVQMVMIDDKVVAPLVDADSDTDDNVDGSKISRVRTNFCTYVKR